MKSIDMHTHIIPRSFIDTMEKDFSASLKTKDGNPYIAFRNGRKHPCEDVYYDMAARVKYMDKANIDIHGISISPGLLYYDFPAETGIKLAVLSNNEINQIVKQHPDRFFPVGTIPLQDIQASVEEIQRIKREFNFHAVQIGTECRGKCISDESFFPVYEAAAKASIKIIIHPFAYGRKEYMEDYYLANFVGNPLFTTLAAANLVFSGVFDRYPDLIFILCHGGGFVPYQIGRFDHGYAVRSEPKKNIRKHPSYYFKNHFYIDTILHDKKALRYLVDQLGSEKILLGSDFPADMGDHDPYHNLLKLGLTRKELGDIACSNSQKLFLLDV